MVLQTVLVVAQDQQLAMTLVSWLSDSGCQSHVTTSYSAGKDHLEGHPALVISELKLGAYNGLHLALRARAKGIPAVIFGAADSITAREAERIGAAYLDSSNLQKDQLQSLIRDVVTPLRGGSPRLSSAPQASCENAEMAHDTDTSEEN